MADDLIAAKAKKLSVVTGARVPAEFKPQEAKLRDAQADAVIDYAKRVHDWPLLFDAVDQKMEDQTEFVRWWKEKITVRQSPGPGGYLSSAGLRTIAMSDAEDQTGITNQQVSRWRKRLKDQDSYRLALFGAAYKAAMAERTDQRGASGTGENEWYTPHNLLELARDVLGDFDLDPASSVIAQEMVQAGEYFTVADNGLAHEWHGRIWLNPPYGQPLIAAFVSKMVAERRAGHVTAGIMLTHNYTDTAWFQEAAGVADAICFTRGRVKFYNAKGVVAAPTQGQAFMYFGDDRGRFAARFASIGFTVLPFRAAR